MQIFRLNEKTSGIFRKSPQIRCFISNLHIVVGEEGINGGLSTGGLAGESNADITNCTVTEGSVSGGDRVGGLVGVQYTGVVRSCYTDTVVRGDSEIGGLAGHIERGNVLRCYAGGDVSGVQAVGGLVGANTVRSRCQIKDSYAFGNVSGNNMVGGLAGMNMATVHSSYSAGKVNGVKVEESGRFIGYDMEFGGDVKDNVAVCWHDSPKHTSYNTGVTEVEGEDVRKRSTYQNFDFAAVWAIDDNTSLPYLQWQKGRLHPDGTSISDAYDVTDLGYTYGNTVGRVDTSYQADGSG